MRVKFIKLGKHVKTEDGNDHAEISVELRPEDGVDEAFAYARGILNRELGRHEPREMKATIADLIRKNKEAR